MNTPEQEDELQRAQRLSLFFVPIVATTMVLAALGIGVDGKIARGIGYTNAAFMTIVMILTWVSRVWKNIKIMECSPLWVAITFTTLSGLSLGGMIIARFQKSAEWVNAMIWVVATVVVLIYHLTEGKKK